MTTLTVNNSYMTIAIDLVQAKVLVEFLRECTSNGKTSIKNVLNTAESMKAQGIQCDTSDVLGAIYSFNSVVAPWLEKAAAPVKQDKEEQQQSQLMMQPGSEAIN